ncbi:NrfD/PsrC family molybdoenzyme membrane anchor subunit [Allobranchiibius sp. GilTou73]|uniref:NrfD/PsrC family molybdoenzyme membrane anchor subunit n=1 Tax=Allobranchiibius sp. GilTou73 TaxID=2904523 RepID=UPI001F1A4CA3|nr:NrfD/PsrC family molybdoenzyme membrane anchor subunit [Allobranchiibius sp. GilTou73]UIJ33705.1 polysulfide reductase NrfD [Allobranchiibius sp. GilTou73]
MSPRRGPEDKFTSYYGRPILKPPTWEPLDIAGYLFAGGLAGASSALAAGAELTGRPALVRSTRLTALGALGVSFVALVHDLGRPARFVNMLRVAKPTSPMSMGSWLLTMYAPLVGLAAGAELVPLPLLRRVAPVAGRGAAVLGAGVATYTAVLIGDTAVPTWHDAHRQLPFVFAGSAAASAGGVASALTPLAQSGPARRVAVAAAVAELAATTAMERSGHLSMETLHEGRARSLMTAAKGLTGGGALVLGALGGRYRAAAAVGGLALAAGSVCLRFGIFEAGRASTLDPRYVIEPQRRSSRSPSAADSAPSETAADAPTGG